MELKKDTSTLIKVDCPTPATIANDLSRSICIQKVNASISKLTILGILAGVYISFGASLATMVGHDVSKYIGVGLSKFLIGSVFSVGLMLVVIAGAELFTGNNLIFIGVLDKRISIQKMLYNWIVVYVANFLGSMLFVFLFYHTNLWKSGDFRVGIFALKIASEKVNLSFLEALTRGILCNWLVCLAVWMSFASRDIIGKIFAIFFPIMTFVAMGFEHSIANMYFIPIGIFLKSTNLFADLSLGLNLDKLNWGNFFVKNLIPVTIGNIIGGSIFVGLLYWKVYIKQGLSQQ